MIERDKKITGSANRQKVLWCILCPVREGVAFLLLLLFSAARHAVDGGPFCSFLLY